MRSFAFCFFLCMSILQIRAQIDTLNIQHLKGVTVSGQYIQQAADHYNCISVNIRTQVMNL